MYLSLIHKRRAFANGCGNKYMCHAFQKGRALFEMFHIVHAHLVCSLVHVRFGTLHNTFKDS